MGNRGKGAKGKSSKRGRKGKKGAVGKACAKWGDEQTAADQEDSAPVKTKRRVTQETQDRQRRVKLMELARAKEQQRRERLSKPNYEPIIHPEAAAPKPRKRKRKRPLKHPGASRDTPYYSSSDEENPHNTGFFDAGLATYNKLLTALESGKGSSKGGLLSADGGDNGGFDHDLAAAVRARRMQREGRDGYASKDESESGSSDDLKEHEVGDADGSAEEESEGELDTEAKIGKVNQQEQEMIGVENLAGGDGLSISNGQLHGKIREQNGGQEGGDDRAEADLHEAVETGDLGVDEDKEHSGAAINGGTVSRDEFNRHFVSTPVFPPEEAAQMLASSARPTFKPLANTSGLRKWEAAGLSVSASKSADLPPVLDPDANLSRELGVLPSLADGWDTNNEGISSPSRNVQSLIMPPIMGYRDMMYCGWRDEDAGAIRRSYALHALNHALTSQRRVLRHTVKLRKAAEELRMAEEAAREEKRDAAANSGQLSRKLDNGNGVISQGSSNRQDANGCEVTLPAAAATQSEGKMIADPDLDEWQRDQGFTRPKVLVLLPFRALAHEVVEIMIGLLGPKTVVINKERFDDEYGPDKNGDDLGLDEDPSGKKTERAKAVVERKPADWKALLGEGRNVDDMFTIGMSISPGGGKGKPGAGKGVGVRLYCDFYNSDIVIASPVALHRASVPSGGEESNDDVDADFLSSVEVCILDRADVFLMQNWAYVPEIAEVLNARPSGDRAARVDFSRVRHLFLHDQGRLFRQTLIFSAFQDANLNALVSRHCRNHDGIVKVWRPSGDGHICNVALQAKQVFQRVPSESPSTQDDARFEYFVGTVLPQILRRKQSHTAMFIPSYFDYVRVRNYLLKNQASVVNVHEYSRGSEVARSRARFFRGDRDLLLYTGRAHFFNRYCIRGIHHLVFYSLPEYPQFYPEMVNLLEEAESVAAVTCLSLFTRFERLSLERIVGEERASHMLRSAKNTFLFC